jgi:hypothetical protein
MPVEYLIVNERHLVITTAWDVVTVAEATAHQERLKHDPDFSPEFHQLLDGTGITVLHLSTEEAKMLARNSPPFSPSSRRAWVAPTPFLFGMGRLIATCREMAGGEEQFQVFYKRSEALKWLGLDVPLRASAVKSLYVSFAVERCSTVLQESIMGKGNSLQDRSGGKRRTYSGKLTFAAKSFSEFATPLRAKR